MQDFKRKRRETTYFKDYCTFTSTGNESLVHDSCSNDLTIIMDYWKINAFYRIFDNYW